MFEGKAGIIFLLFHELSKILAAGWKHKLAFERMKVHIRSRGDRRLSGGVDLTAGLGSQSRRELLGKLGHRRLHFSGTKRKGRIYRKNKAKAELPDLGLFDKSASCQLANSRTWMD